MDHDEDYQGGGESHASSTYPMQCSALRKNGHVMIKSRPCKIVEMSTSKTGKHGHAKVHLVGIDIFTGKKYEDLCPSTHNIDVPHVQRLEFQLVDITDDDYLSLMNEKGEIRDDLKLPEDKDINTGIKEEFAKGNNLVVTVISACKEEAVIGYKNSTN